MLKFAPIALRLDGCKETAWWQTESCLFVNCSSLESKSNELDEIEYSQNSVFAIISAYGKTAIQ